MGFFSSLANMAKKAIKAVGTVAVGVPVAVVSWAAQKVGLIDDVSEEVGKTEALTDSSSTRQVENVADVLNKYLEGCQKEAEENEILCQRYVSGFFDYLINDLEKREDIADGIGLDRLKRSQRKLTRGIRGAITNPIATRLTMDNSECREILSMSHGEEKNRKMRLFANKVIHEATLDLTDKTCEAMEEQWLETEQFLKEHMQTQEQEANRQKKLLEQWERDMESDNFNKEKARLIPSVKLYAFEQVEKIIEA